MLDAIKTIATILGSLFGLVLIPIGGTVREFYLSVGHAQVASWTLATVILGASFVYVAQPDADKLAAEIRALDALTLQREAEAAKAKENERWLKLSADKLEAGP